MRILLLLINCLFSCNSKQNKSSENKKNESLDKSKIGNLGIDSGYLEPIWGHRFQLVGDFDGDKKEDTLTEYFYSEKRF